MADTYRPPAARCPPRRQAQGTLLNTIMEDTRESSTTNSPQQSKGAVTSPKLTLKTSGLSGPINARLARLMSPLSAGTLSSCSACSDTEWQEQGRGFDDLYDATDEDDMDDDNSTDISSTFSPAGTRPLSLETPITRNSLTSNGSQRSRKQYLTLDIPSSPRAWAANPNHKSSPVPPTPPPKIPVSPAALSLLARSVPASHAPPSLDGSISSDQESIISALATPDTHSLPDTNWDAQDVLVRPDADGSENGDLEAGSDAHAQIVPITIESPQDDWRQVLGNFPRIPTAHQNDSTSSLSCDEPSREPTPSDQGVCLPDGALAMLQHIRLDGTPESWSETSEGNDEMSQLQIPSSRPRSAEGVTPASELSSYSFTELSIPSPGGFFASLAPRARHTWSIPTSNHAPTSAVAESFYNLPWRRDDGEIVEQIVECPDLSHQEDPVTAVRDEQGPPTAIRVPCETPTRSVAYQDSPMSASFAVQEIPRSENVYEYEECYDQELQDRAADSLDRTSVWLAAQATYMAALSETNPVNELDDTITSTYVEEDCPVEAQDAAPKKAVRFVDGVPEAKSPLPPVLASRDSIYWRGFQSIRERAGRSDGFIHRNMRYDAIQSFRLGLVDMHINTLMGKYEIVCPDRPAYKGPFSKAPRNSTTTADLAEKAQFSKLQKEQLVLAQICQPMWAMDALKFLSGGKMLTSPAYKRLAHTNKQLKNVSQQQRKVRILDLGGQASCEWAWEAAYEYPNAKVYSVVSKDQVVNSGIKGPENHRLVPVANLWELPFGDNKFDVISARTLHALLKTECPAGFDLD